MTDKQISALLEQTRSDLISAVEERMAQLASALASPGKPQPRRKPTRPAHVPSYTPTDLDRAKARAALHRMGLGG